MASGNTVTLTFAGDSSSLERSMGNVGAKATAMAADFDKAEAKSRSFGGAVDKAGEAAGNSESKFMGTADLLDGLGGAFGLPTEGATGMMRAFGDLSGGFEVVQGMFSSGIGKLGQLASSLGITSLATKVWTGIQAAFNLVMEANPIFLVGAAVVALGAALVIAYQRSETFRNIVQGAFGAVQDAAESVWGFIRTIPDKLLGIGEAIKNAILWPYKTAFNMVADLWNHTLGAVGFEVPSWVPGVGGKGWHFPEMPRFHTGGIVPGPPGAEVPILAMAGETVIPAGGGRRMYSIVVNALDPTSAAQAVVRAIDAFEANNGPRFARA
jgi:hypothetical protein